MVVEFVKPGELAISEVITDIGADGRNEFIPIEVDVHRNHLKTNKEFKRTIFCIQIEFMGVGK